MGARATLKCINNVGARTSKSVGVRQELILGECAQQVIRVNINHEAGELYMVVVMGGNMGTDKQHQVK